MLVTMRNLVRCVLWLGIVLILTAGVFLMLGALYLTESPVML